MLGREPESATIALNWARSGKSLDDLIDYISKSSEFADYSAQQIKSKLRLRPKVIAARIIVLIAIMAFAIWWIRTP